MCTKRMHTLVHFSFFTRTQGACTRHWNTGTFTGQPGTGRGVSKQETLAQPLAHTEADPPTSISESCPYSAPGRITWKNRLFLNIGPHSRAFSSSDRRGR